MYASALKIMHHYTHLWDEHIGNLTLGRCLAVANRISIAIVTVLIPLSNSLCDRSLDVFLAGMAEPSGRKQPIW
jgi:hypothetical protein